MTNHELLGMAAKAAGIDRGEDRFDYGLSTTEKDGRHRHLPRWNPLDDDGDALRLAVKLRISFGIVQYTEAWAQFYRCDNHVTGWITIEEPVGNDPYLATRRAIVRASAEISKGMEL